MTSSCAIVGDKEGRNGNAFRKTVSRFQDSLDEGIAAIIDIRHAGDSQTPQPFDIGALDSDRPSRLTYRDEVGGHVKLLVYAGTGFYPGFEKAFVKKSGCMRSGKLEFHPHTFP